MNNPRRKQERSVARLALIAFRTKLLSHDIYKVESTLSQ